ncbi:putative RNA-binding protein C328,05 OS=Schizosaccharomyces pombe (strain 972 / ATCC 24843) GN=SPAC328.05 PE=4 SV=3 [Rhizoctonia solani AG-1 IB]|uniref:Putative RNA-binding protein C328,05 n=1 Tax=Thanatephorus cucumeris (strain AG1-IB / isolate 7/3/14) TaxID=1108050 RepID=M5C5Q0_THACB|nr:putative RNA-binding protein C328,05 [Rhizoctonia solani AG-1 IB]CEL57322.1 putative RNA-binding protein C328,05 OS=Schizosaccharomyces pombe (strain 972 / ATCC 24843) GN=SPAC328.05 PE=4 SV=3 [Rhizoctonia solani AG-1 IB]
MASPTVEQGRASSATPSKLIGLPTGRSATPKSASAQTPPAKLDDDTIEDVIQRATASAGAGPPPGKDTRTQLFVGNLPYRVRWQDLKDLFRKAGTVLRADVSLGPDNRSRGYGTVLLATAEDAGKATDMYNGYVWQNRTLEVRPDRLPPELDMGLNHAGAAGGVSSVPITNPMVPLAVPQPGHVLDPLSRPMSAAIGQDGPAHSPGIFAPSPFGSNPSNWTNSGFQGGASNRQLFIGNLPFQCQWQDLKDLFRAAGQILRADVALGPDGRSRGFGTVVYAKESDAARAVTMFNGYDYNGRILKVHYDRYSPTNQSGSLSPNSMHAVVSAPLGIMVPPLQTESMPPSNHQSSGMHLAMPQTPEYMLFPPHSQPASPFEQYPSTTQMHALMSAYERGALSPPPGGRNILDTTVLAPSDPGSPGYGPGSPHMSQGSNLHPHPGPITLPPSGVTQFPPASALSPLMTRAGGLPPMTPSMPGFNFNPQAVATPPLHPHFLSPGLGPFSPQLPFVSSAPNPYLNPAPGAPPRLPNAPSSLFTNGPGAFGMHHAPSTTHSGYFPPPHDPGYFIGMQPDEDSKEKEQESDSLPHSEASQLGLEGAPTGSTTTSFDVGEGLALQLRDVKLDESVPIARDAPQRPSFPARTSLPDVAKTDSAASTESALAITPDEEPGTMLGLGFTTSRVSGVPRNNLNNEPGYGPVGSGDRRASWNATTSRVRAGVQAPVP